MKFEKTSEREEKVAAHIVDAAYSVHKTLGPGLLELYYNLSVLVPSWQFK
ncbi:MAG: hypothetical protein ISS70_08770 [Phycisphaerae bacterium]|nr:hypothetical protein [Phycisphaerae bacterium]